MRHATRGRGATSASRDCCLGSQTVALGWRAWRRSRPPRRCCAVLRLPGRPGRAGAGRRDRPRPGAAALDHLPPARDADRATGFVVHLPEERRYGLGRAPPTSWARATPGRRRCSGSARLPLAGAGRPRPGTTRTSPCCTAATSSTSSRSGRRGRPPLVTDVGVRLPAHLTASGRAMLAALPAAQVRALFPDPRRRSSQRNGGGPALAVGAAARCSSRPGARGYADEDGEVTAGLRLGRRRGARPRRPPGRRASRSRSPPLDRRRRRGRPWPARCGPRRPSSPGASGAAHPTDAG